MQPYLSKCDCVLLCVTYHGSLVPVWVLLPTLHPDSLSLVPEGILVWSHGQWGHIVCTLWWQDATAQPVLLWPLVFPCAQCGFVPYMCQKADGERASSGERTMLRACVGRPPSISCVKIGDLGVQLEGFCLSQKQHCRFQSKNGALAGSRATWRRRREAGGKREKNNSISVRKKMSPKEQIHQKATLRLLSSSPLAPVVP